MTILHAIPAALSRTLQYNPNEYDEQQIGFQVLPNGVVCYDDDESLPSPWMFNVQLDDDDDVIGGVVKCVVELAEIPLHALFGLDALEQSLPDFDQGPSFKRLNMGKHLVNMDPLFVRTNQCVSRLVCDDLLESNSNVRLIIDFRNNNQPVFVTPYTAMIAFEAWLRAPLTDRLAGLLDDFFVPNDNDESSKSIAQEDFVPETRGDLLVGRTTVEDFFCEFEGEPLGSYVVRLTATV